MTRYQRYFIKRNLDDAIAATCFARDDEHAKNIMADYAAFYAGIGEFASDFICERDPSDGHCFLDDEFALFGGDVYD